MHMMMIRPALADDLDAITIIYNDAILKTTATFDIEPRTTEQQKVWFNSHDSRYPILVAEINNIVVGWSSVSEFCGRCAYDQTGEVSVYVKEEYRNKGYGRELLKAIVKQAELVKYHTLIARIAEGNKISVALFESEGFFHVGVMKEVGFKFNRWLDVLIMQKILK